MWKPFVLVTLAVVAYAGPTQAFLASGSTCHLLVRSGTARAACMMTDNAAERGARRPAKATEWESAASSNRAEQSKTLRISRAAALRHSASLATAYGALLCTNPAPVRAGTVLVGGEAVDAEEELDDEAYDALEKRAGPLDGLLEKVNFKKLGVAGGAFLL